MDRIKLLRDEIFSPGEAFHFSRVVLSRKSQKHCHIHDFPELFWVQHGQAHHLINGHRETLSEGDTVFIRPDDCHALRGRGDETHLVSVAFCPDMIKTLAARHRLKGQLFWSTGPLPVKFRRDARQLAVLSRRALTLEAGARTALSAEAFLLPLISELFSSKPQLPKGAPGWLIDACHAAQTPDIYRKGAAGLVRASGKSHAHVSRSFQKYIGQTPSNYINRIRMDHAAISLAGMSDDLTDIALECGIANLSHFHRLFREHHGMTPAQYRRKFQKNAVQPT